MPTAGAAPAGCSAGDRRGQEVVKRRKKLRRLRARRCWPRSSSTSRGSSSSAAPTAVSFRIDGRARTVNVRLYVLPATGRKAVETIELGELSTRATHTAHPQPRRPAARALPRCGSSARDRRGRALRRATAVGAWSRTSSSTATRFPLIGAFSYGGEGSRFGRRPHGPHPPGPGPVGRRGRDRWSRRTAACVETVEYQAEGAGHYVVVGGERRARLRVHAPAHGLDPRARGPARAHRPAARRGRQHRRAPPGPTSTSRSGRAAAAGTTAATRSTRCRYLKSWDRYS